MDIKKHYTLKTNASTNLRVLVAASQHLNGLSHISEFEKAVIDAMESMKRPNHTIVSNSYKVITDPANWTAEIWKLDVYGQKKKLLAKYSPNL